MLTLQTLLRCYCYDSKHCSVKEIQPHHKIMDTQLFFFINGHHNVFLDNFMYFISLKTVWIPLYFSILYIVWRNYSWKGVAIILITIGAGMLFTDWANAHLLRPWIGRLRPSNPDNPISSMVHIVNGKRGSGCGFPSAHSANIWLLTFVVVRFFRDKIVSRTMIVTALLVCYSRVYLGYHYPGDILGGFVLAYIVSAVLMWINEHYLHFATKREILNARVVMVTTAITLTIFAILSQPYTFSDILCKVGFK